MGSTAPLRVTDEQVAAYRAATNGLWRRGILAPWKLDRAQCDVYRSIFHSQASRFVLEIARRWGKTFLLVTIAIETCLRTPKVRVVYGAPTLKHLAEFVLPAFEAIIADAPPDCRPVWNSARGHWTFPNGSYVHLFGADDKRKADRGRGPASVLAIFDEAGFTPVLRYVIRSVFRPQLLSTGGRMLLASTPAEDPDHDFTAVAEIAERNGTYARLTIHDSPRYTKEQIEKFIADDARDEGMSVEAYVTSDDFRREYLAERVINKLLVVVPEWEAVAAECTLAVKRPDHFDAWTVLDPGGADPHAVTFGYWDFARSVLVVEDELLQTNGENTAELAAAVKAKEDALWGAKRYEGTVRALTGDPDPRLLEALPQWLLPAVGAKNVPEQPYMRWSDNNLITVRDLYALHGLLFAPTAKDDKNAAVNNLRVLVGAKKVLVNPRCVHTLRHLRTTTWKNHKRREYARRAGEHGDCLDTLVYAARNVDQHRNPAPPITTVGAGLYRSLHDTEQESTATALARLFTSGNPRARR